MVRSWRTVPACSFRGVVTVKRTCCGRGEREDEGHRAERQQPPRGHSGERGSQVVTRRSGYGRTDTAGASLWCDGWYSRSRRRRFFASALVDIGEGRQPQHGGVVPVDSGVERRVLGEADEAVAVVVRLGHQAGPLVVGGLVAIRWQRTKRRERNKRSGGGAL